LASRSSQGANQNLPKSMAAPTHGEKNAAKLNEGK